MMSNTCGLYLTRREWHAIVTHMRSVRRKERRRHGQVNHIDKHFKIIVQVKDSREFFYTNQKNWRSDKAGYVHFETHLSMKAPMKIGK